MWKPCILKSLGPSNPAGGTLVIIRRLIVPLTIAAVCAVHAMEARAQGGFPAPLPGASAPPAADPAFPPVNGAAMIGRPTSAFPSNGAPPVSGGFSPPAPQQAGPPGGSDECMNGFLPLRQDAEKRGAMIKTASERHAPPDEACKLITNFAQAEVKMIKYIESHQQKCGIPAQIGDQMRAGHKNTEGLLKKVCAAAQQQQARGAAGPSLSDVLGSSTALPEAAAAKKSGGTTFDTLNGNVLSR
jgi:hypothetical protein